MLKGHLKMTNDQRTLANRLGQPKSFPEVGAGVRNISPLFLWSPDRIRHWENPTKSQGNRNPLIQPIEPLNIVHRRPEQDEKGRKWSGGTSGKDLAQT